MRYGGHTGEGATSRRLRRDWLRHWQRGVYSHLAASGSSEQSRGWREICMLKQNK